MSKRIDDCCHTNWEVSMSVKQPQAGIWRTVFDPQKPYTFKCQFPKDVFFRLCDVCSITTAKETIVTYLAIE